MNTENFNEHMRAFYGQRRANRRANNFLAFCTELWERRTGTQLGWLVDAAVRTYMPELLGENFTEAEVWPSLRPKVLEDLKRADLQAWSVRNSCPIDHLDAIVFAIADHVIITERWKTPRFEAYKLPVDSPWVFIGAVNVGPDPYTGRTPTKPSWWDHPRQYWKQTSGWRDGRPVFEPAVSVRPSYDASLAEVRSDLQRLSLPLEAHKIKTGGLFEIVWNRYDETYEMAEHLCETAARRRKDGDD